MFSEEALRIVEIARRDPSFGHVPGHLLEEAGARLAAAPSLDAFRLEAMRCMALAGNGHSRAIVHHAAMVAPIRFVWLCDGPCVATGALEGARLVAVNGIGAEELLDRLRPFLAGTDQRASVLAGFMLAWPPALQWATGETGPPVFSLRTVSGDLLEHRPGQTIPAETLYPVRERGAAPQLIARRFLTGLREAEAGIFLRSLSPGIGYVRIGDLGADPEGWIALRLSRILEELRGTRGIVVDLRGNPGGNFFGAEGFARRLRTVAPAAVVVALVDRFTFSAAIVTAALLKVHAGALLIGEEMGDHARFFAEGGTVDLPFSGVHIRHSSGWHDWQDGRPDPASTPARIAAAHVAAGPLLPDLPVRLEAAHLAQGQDVVLDRAIGHLADRHRC